MESERSRKSGLMFADKGRSEASSESSLMQKQMRRQEGADSSVTHSDVCVKDCVCLFISVKNPKVVVTVSDTQTKGKHPPSRKTQQQ